MKKKLKKKHSKSFFPQISEDHPEQNTQRSSLRLYRHSTVIPTYNFEVTLEGWPTVSADVFPRLLDEMSNRTATIQNQSSSPRPHNTQPLKWFRGSVYFDNYNVVYEALCAAREHSRDGRLESDVRCLEANYSIQGGPGDMSNHGAGHTWSV